MLLLRNIMSGNRNGVTRKKKFAQGILVERELGVYCLQRLAGKCVDEHCYGERCGAYFPVSVRGSDMQEMIGPRVVEKV